jgi:hypothetical protein
VARCVREKIVKNAAKTIFCQSYHLTFTVEKVNKKTVASGVMYKKIADSKQSPNRRKIAQSGHPAHTHTQEKLFCCLTS